MQHSVGGYFRRGNFGGSQMFSCIRQMETDVFANSLVHDLGSLTKYGRCRRLKVVKKGS